MKKIILGFCVLAFASLALAGTPSKDLVDVSRLLVNNPSVMAELTANHVDHLSFIESKTLSRGVVEYTLVFDRMCHCLPTSATVTIVEDLTPTYRDGAPVYKTSVSIAH